MTLDVYRQWMQDLDLPANPAGLCRAMSELMVAEFPELVLVKGHFVACDEGREGRQYPHWWVRTADGEILDPTARQFAGLPGYYVEHVGPDPTGRCMNCGNYCYGGRSLLCSDSCAQEYQAYLVKGLNGGPTSVPHW